MAREHPAYRQRLSRERAVKALTMCCYPECEQPVAKALPQPVGLCLGHALDVWASVDESGDTLVPITHYRLNRKLEQHRREEREAEAALSRDIAPGWVYYLLVGDRIKIGWTADVRSRMRAYPPNADLLAVHPGTKMLERDLHHQFTSWLAAGREWFADCEDIRAHIAQVLERFGEVPKEFRHTYRERGRQRIKPRGW